MHFVAARPTKGFAVIMRLLLPVLELLEYRVLQDHSCQFLVVPEHLRLALLGQG